LLKRTRPQRHPDLLLLLVLQRNWPRCKITEAVGIVGVELVGKARMELVATVEAVQGRLIMCVETRNIKPGIALIGTLLLAVIAHIMV